MSNKKKIILISVVAALLIAAGIIAYFAYFKPKAEREFVAVVPGVLYRSRQPGPEQCELYRQHDIKTVVNLRTAREDPDWQAAEVVACRESGVRYVNLPFFTALPSDDQLRHFLVLARTQPPLLVHCKHGRSRTGFMVAAYRVVVQDWSPDDAWKEALSLGDTETAKNTESNLPKLKELQRDKSRWLRDTANLAATQAASTQASTKASTQATQGL